jgi:hypothetical protein
MGFSLPKVGQCVKTHFGGYRAAQNLCVKGRNVLFPLDFSEELFDAGHKNSEAA